MKYLVSQINQVLRRISRAERILLLFDYDGTLTPIVGHPKDAHLDDKMRNIIKRLKAKKRVTVGIISGRKLSELKEFIKVNGIYYAGNHGLELAGPKVRFIHSAFAQFKPHIKEIYRKLKSCLKGTKGIVIENKGISLSLHYRLARKPDELKIKKAFKRIVCAYVKKRKIKITSGKKVLEVRPAVFWNKGNALKLIERFIHKTKNTITIFMGDDRTDEDAFKVLGKKDISIFVGSHSRKSSARYYLKNPDEVAKFLNQILAI